LYARMAAGPPGADQGVAPGEGKPGEGMVWRVLGVLLATVWTGRGGALQAAPEPVRITVDGERLTYGLSEGGWARLSGDVRVHVSSPELAAGELELHCGEVEVDLLRGCLRAPGEVKLQAGPGLMAGQGLTMNARTQEFAMGSMSACVGQDNGRLRPGEPWPIIYASGQQVNRRGSVLIALRGKVTTCDRDHPHWSVGARKLIYNVNSGLLQMEHVDLHVLGVRIPVLPWAKLDLGPQKRRWGVNWNTTPGYESREGVFVPYSWRLTNLESPWDAGAYFHITAEQGLTGTVKAARSWGATDFDLRATRKEWMPDDITDQLELYRLPELSVTRYLCERDNCNREMRVDLRLGRYRETLVAVGEDGGHADRLRKRVSGSRAGLAATYTVGAPDLLRHEGGWYGVSGRWAEYSTDEHYGDLELFAGGGAQLSPGFSAYGTLHHHLVTGSSPFLFDDVDIRTELAAGADWQIDRLWRLRGTARVDLDRGTTRDYELGLSRRFHCLTWGFTYRGIGNQLRLGVDLTGFSGDTRPYRAQSSLQRRLETEGLQLQPPASSWGNAGGGRTGAGRPAAAATGGALCPPGSTPPAPASAEGQPGAGEPVAPDTEDTAPQGASTETK
jgi:hypothetical protein